MIVSILTGFSAGALHVIGGADHVIAMAPEGLKRPKSALKAGLAWGIGHSTGVLVLSSIAILVKDLSHIEKLSSFAELTVGIALLVAGVIAIRTSLGLDIHSHKHMHKDGKPHEHVHLHLRGQKKHNRHPHAVTSLGILHGLAGASHLLAVIPALALPPVWAISYLMAYLFGSITAMTSLMITISIASLGFGRKVLPIIMGSVGCLSIATGIFWIQQTSLNIF